MTELIIRHVEDSDAQAVHEILTARHVAEGTMRLTVATTQSSRARIAPADGVFKLVALSGGEVAGFCELITHPDVPAHRHAGEVNMVATHPGCRGRGVGEAMMQHMLDLSDNWLQLSRLGLTVWARNSRAVALYEKLGFEVEGTMRDYVFRNGEYLDALVMGRLVRRDAGREA